MEGQQKQTQKKRRRFPWMRAIVALVAFLLLSAAAILFILSAGHVITGDWSVVMPIIFTVIGLLIPLGQWLFPISSEAPSNPPQSPSLAEPATQNEQTKPPTTIWSVPQDSIVLIKSSNPSNKGFGTGFVIHRDKDASYILTCARVLVDVLRDAGGQTLAIVDGCSATVVASGAEDGIDLAVLKVEGLLDKIPLGLRSSGKIGSNYSGPLK